MSIGYADLGWFGEKVVTNWSQILLKTDCNNSHLHIILKYV